MMLAAPSLCAAKDRYANTAAVARKEATAALESAGVFSVTTAVMVDGRIVYAGAFGMIGSDRSTPADTETQFNAGSVSKVFTAVAMLRLRDQGRIDLDKPVVHYLPHFRMNDKRYRRITIRTLLDHTAGMPGTNYYKLFGSQENPAYVTETLALLRDSPLESNPGDMNVYCNDCFTVASAVIERVSGMSFAEFMRREVFMKARMSDSSYSFKEGNRICRSLCSRLP
jgi:CubicO group peptidase (beta-lactamase class C family)